MLCLFPFVVLFLNTHVQSQSIELSDECTASQLLSFEQFTTNVFQVDFDGENTNRYDVVTIVPDPGITSTAVSTGDDASLCEGSGAPVNCVYVLVEDLSPGQQYIAILNESSFDDVIGLKLFNETIINLDLKIASIAFDCDGGLFGVTVDDGDLVSINPVTGAVETVTEAEQTCSGGANLACEETLFYSLEEQEFYRISSSPTNGTSLLCEIEENDCVEITDPDGLCFPGGGFIVSVVDVGEGAVYISCQENRLNSEAQVFLLDVEDAEIEPISGEVGQVGFPDYASTLAFFNQDTGGYCSCTFDGTADSPTTTGEDSGGSGDTTTTTEEGGDDDDSSSDSDSDDSDNGSDDDDSDGDSDDDSDDDDDDARAVAADVDDITEEAVQGDEETQITYTISLSDSSLHVAWIMFGVCLLINLSGAFCVWKSSAHTKEVVV